SVGTGSLERAVGRTAAATTGCVTSPQGSASATLAGLGTTVMLPARRDFSARAARSGVTAPTAGPATPRAGRVAAAAGGEGGSVTNVSGGAARRGERGPPNPELSAVALSHPRSAGGARVEGVAVEILWVLWL
ncbi:hypothetical protein DV515_00008565, partial [Chloebia gouldiae]